MAHAPCALVLQVPHAICFIKPHVPCALCALVHNVPRSLDALVPYVSLPLSVLVLQMPRAIRVLVPYIPYALCPLVLYNPFFLTYPKHLVSFVLFVLISPFVLLGSHAHAPISFSFPTFDFLGEFTEVRTTVVIQ